MVAFFMTLLVLWPLNNGDDDLTCDRVMTSEHGVLLVRRGTVTSDICLGELRLHDPVTNKIFCLDREEGEELLECEENPSTLSTTSGTFFTHKKI